MLTGRQAFGGEALPDIIAEVLGSDPDWNRLPANTPAGIVDLLERCLEKEPRRRLHDIAVARIVLGETKNNTSSRSRIRQSRKDRLTLLTFGFLLCVLLLATGMRLANLRDEGQPGWAGSLLVGGSTVAWGPRVSPDGRRVAFIVMVDAQTQVALMDADSGTWDVITRQAKPGVRMHAAWSRDGTKIYFTRGSTEGANIYSIPAVGGEERLVLDNAFFPEPLPDGSMLVTRSNASGQPQLNHFWPETNRLEALPALLTPALDPLVPVRAFADGKEAVFFGRTMTATGVDSQRDVHIIDLETKKTRKLASNLGVNAPLWPVSTDRDRSVLTDVPAGDLHRIVAIDRAGRGAMRSLLTLTGRFSGIDMAEDGTIFVDQQNNTLEILRIGPSSGFVQRVAGAETYLLNSHTVELSDGRVIVPSLMSGRPRLMLTKTNERSTPLIDTAEETSGPITVVGTDLVAFLMGRGAARVIAIASLSDRRILRRISVNDADSIVQLAASVDAASLYYISAGTLWELPSAGGTSRKLGVANSIAVDPNGRDIILQRIGSNFSIQLFRMNLSKGSEEQIPIREDVRMGEVPLAANAINKDGKILVTTALDETTWYWQLSIFDPRTGSASHVPTDFAGDLLYAGWTPDGQILATGVNTEGAIWRFRPQPAGN